MDSPLRHIQAAIDACGVDHTVDEVITRIQQGTAHLWTAETATGVTEYDGKDLHIWLAGGKLSGLLAMLPSVESFARVSACNRVILGGRKGWRRVFLRFGYEPQGNDMVKVL